MLCLNLEKRARYILIFELFTDQVAPLSGNMGVLEKGTRNGVDKSRIEIYIPASQKSSGNNVISKDETIWK